MSKKRRKKGSLRSGLSGISVSPSETMLTTLGSTRLSIGASVGTPACCSTAVGTAALADADNAASRMIRVARFRMCVFFMGWQRVGSVLSPDGTEAIGHLIDQRF